MRRPLNWIVVSISLLVLWVSYDDSKPRQTHQTPLASIQTISATASPFAYVLEDGSQEFLPGAASTQAAPESSFERLHAEQGFDSAVYTWSSPVLTSVEPSLQ